MPSFAFQLRSLFNIVRSLLLFFVIFAGVACSGSGDAPTSAVGESDEEGVRLITRPDSSYVINDLVAAGFKRNKQVPVDEVPGAIDIWYGFFQQQDIEVRFYESHTDAVELGVEPAEIVIARTAGQRDYLIPVVNLYPAYAVVGNTVMLCERQLATCEALIAVLD